MFDSLHEPEDNPKTAKWLFWLGLALGVTELLDRYYTGRFSWLVAIVGAPVAFAWYFLRRW